MPRHRNYIGEIQVGAAVAEKVKLVDDTSGATVQVPGPSGDLDALRVSQVHHVDPPVVPPGSGIHVPRDMSSRVVAAVGFASGIPLTPGRLYSWHVEIDGRRLGLPRAQFLVPGPRPGPVFGGPAGPSSIPPPG